MIYGGQNTYCREERGYEASDEAMCGTAGELIMVEVVPVTIPSPREPSASIHSFQMGGMRTLLLTSQTKDSLRVVTSILVQTPERI